MNYFPVTPLFVFIGFILMVLALIMGIYSFRIEKTLTPPQMEHKFSWLRELVNFGGTITGIILTAIGGVMVLNTVLKVYVFGFETEPYFNAEDMCQFDSAYQTKMGSAITTPAVPGKVEEPQRLTKEEKAVCVADKTASQKISYLRQKKESMIDGLAMLLFGIPFWIIFNRQRRKYHEEK